MSPQSPILPCWGRVFEQGLSACGLERPVAVAIRARRGLPRSTRSYRDVPSLIPRESAPAFRALPGACCLRHRQRGSTSPSVYEATCGFACARPAASQPPVCRRRHTGPASAGCLAASRGGPGYPSCSIHTVRAPFIPLGTRRFRGAPAGRTINTPPNRCTGARSWNERVHPSPGLQPVPGFRPGECRTMRPGAGRAALSGRG